MPAGSVADEEIVMLLAVLVELLVVLPEEVLPELLLPEVEVVPVVVDPVLVLLVVPELVEPEAVLPVEDVVEPVVLVLVVPVEPVLLVVLTALVGAVTLTVVLCVTAVPAELVQLSVKVVAAVSTPVLAVPLGDSLPLQPPEAVQLVTPVEDHVRVAAAPLVTEFGLTLSDRVGAVDEDSGAVTEMPNGGNEAEVVPSLALMPMLESVPTSLLEGVPLSSPVVVSKRAHCGALRMLHVREPL